MSLETTLASAHASADAMVAASIRRKQDEESAFTSPTAAISAGGRGASTSSIFGSSDRKSAEYYKHNTGWVHAAVRIIADSISGQPVHVGRLTTRSSAQRRRVQIADPELIPSCKSLLHLSLRGRPRHWTRDHADDTAVQMLESHAILDAFASPNDFMVQKSLLSVTAQSYCITGKAFWWLFTEGSRRMIFYLPVHWVSPIHTKERLFDHWVVRPGGGSESFTVPGDEVSFFYNPDPANPTEAISPLAAQSLAISTDESIQTAQAHAFKRGIRPGVIITIGRMPGSVPGQQGQRPILTPNQRKQLHNALMDAYSGEENWDRPYIVDGMVDTIKPFTNSIQEMDFLNSGKQTKSRIFQGYGVNPIVSGEIEGANRASSAAASEHLCERTVNPIIELFSQVMTMTVAPFFGRVSERLVLWLEKCQPRDMEMRLKAENLLVDAESITKNELRSRHHLPPLDDGDVLVSRSLRTEMGAEENLAESNRQARPSVIRIVGTGLVGTGRDRYRQDFIKQVSSRFSRAVDEGQRALRLTVLRFFREQSHEIGVAMERMSGLPSSADSLIDQIFSPRQWEDRFKETLGIPLMQLHVTGAIMAMRSFTRRPNVIRAAVPNPADFRIDLPPDVLDSIREEMTASFEQPWWDDLQDTTRTRLRNQINQGLELGENLDQLKKRIATVLTGEGGKKRAEMIARTETTGSLNAGHNAMVRELEIAGLVEGKEWLPIQDDRLRDSHSDLAGVTVQGADGLFNVGGFEAPYPGHYSLPPAQRANCRCIILSVPVPEFAELLQPEAA